MLWLIFSIPIFTIGASTTALYSVMLKMINKEEGPIFRSFVKAFRSNFKQATLSWLVILAALVAIAGELVFAWALEYEGALATFYLILAFAELVVVCLTLPFLFPLIAKFDNTIWNTLKNAFLLSVSNPGSWVKIFLAWFFPVFICVAYPVVFLLFWYLWLILIIGVIAYGTSFTVRKVLRRVEQAQEKAAEEQKSSKEEGAELAGREQDGNEHRKLSIREKANLKAK